VPRTRFVINYGAMRATASNAATEQAGTDHGFPVVSYAGVRLVDVRSILPDDPENPFRVRNVAGPLSPIEFVSQHHDAGQYDAAALDADATAALELVRILAVYRQHRETNGWPGIGYHTYGFPSGRLYLVGSFETQRANVAKLNHKSIGHCSAGDFTDTVPSVASQLVAAMATIAAWSACGRLLDVNAHGHFALPSDPTGCCGANTREIWIPRLTGEYGAIAAVARQLRT
jgi:hypothetical protein